MASSQAIQAEIASSNERILIVRSDFGTPPYHLLLHCHMVSSRLNVIIEKRKLIVDLCRNFMFLNLPKVMRHVD